MQRKKIQTDLDDNKSLKKVLLFCLIVGSLIVISLLIRFFIVLKHSKFDGNSRFTVAVIQKTSFQVFSFDPATTTISALTVNGKIAGVPPQRAVGVPVDGTITVTR